MELPAARLCSRIPRLRVPGGSRLVTSRRMSASCSDDYPLPWPHFDKPFPVGESPWSRLAGLFLLKRLLLNHGDHHFSLSELLQGVRDCVFHVAAVLSDPVRHVELREIVHPDLHRTLQSALQGLPSSARLQVDIESLQHLRLAAVNTIIGDAPQDDTHTISLLGQKIITSQKAMEEVIENRDRFTAQTARNMGREAFLTKIVIQFMVSFSTTETYSIIEEDGRILMGSNTPREACHIWKFGSAFDWGSSYPLQWTIYDINQYLNKPV